MSLVTRLATRAALPGLGAGLANTKPVATGGGRGGVKAATRNVSYVAPGQPMQSYDSPRGVYQYFASVWVMRCVRTIAQTIAGLPFRAGLDMDDPTNFVRDAPLARLLGPATPEAPGGPNPFTSSRDLWTWTIVQYICTGKWGWELLTDGPGSKGNVAGLWPLVSEYLNPIPTEGTSQFFSGFEYVVSGGERIRLSTDQVFYAWRPSARDWRKPESVLESAKDVVGVQVALDRYYSNLLKNNLYSPVIVKTPPFEEPEEARAFQESFTQEFTGFDNAGKPIFVEYETDDNRASQGKDTGDIQVERLTQTSTDAQLLDLAQKAKTDVTVALGVPESIVGNASQRTFANSSEEFRNYFVITVLPLTAEIQDKVNVGLAPKVGKEVGWFDLSNVDVLAPPQIIAQPSIPDLITNNVATAPQIAEILGISGVTEKGESTETAPATEEPISGSPTKQRESTTAIEVRSKVAELRGARRERERRQVNEFAPTGPGPNVPLGNNYDPTNSGMLAPVGEKHTFKGRNLMACATCGQPRSSPIHTRPERRHSGKPGHQHVVGGHAKSARRVDAEKAAWLTDVNAAEGPLTDALKGLFVDQRKATISRLTGKRGRQMLRALERRQNEPPNTTAASQPPAVTSGTVFTAPFWVDKTATVVQPALGAIGTQAASRVRRQVGAPAVNDQGTLATMQARLAERAQALAQRVTATTANEITAALAEGVHNGEGIDQLTARVNRVFDNADRVRAQMIARTTVVSAANAASTDYAQALPPGIVGKRRWVSHHDSRVRHDHLETDGQEVGIHEPYHVGPDRLPAAYPGDPTLPPSQFINCRCYPGDTLVVASDIRAAFRRWYEGELVEVTTARGHKFAATPNHPILTPTGWVAAGLLGEGNYVVNGSVRDGMTWRDPQVDHMPTPIGELFDSLALSPVVTGAHRVAGSPVDFHGDGCKGDVDVVIADLHLPSAHKPTLFEHRTDELLTLAHTQMGGSRPAATISRVAHAEDVGFAASSWGDASLKQSHTNGRSITPERLGESLLGFPSSVTVDNFVRRQGSSLGGADPTSSDSAYVDPLSFESGTKPFRSNSPGSAGGDHSFASEVQPDRLVKVTRYSFAGHVFNLSTATERYIAEGIVTHNCGQMFLPGTSSATGVAS